jgi:subtilisin-like proprotein convertase family protein
MKTALGLVAAMGLASAASAQVFQNLAPIQIPGTSTVGPSSPYPSAITVSGVSGPVTGVRVSLFDMTHTFPDDIDVLLVGPAGQTVLLMSDAGGGPDITDVDLTFDDGASALPDGSLLVSGVYAPTNFGATADVFPSPAPAGPYGSSLLAAFGTSVNGNWSLFVVDDASADTGSIAGGWQIEVIPSPGAMAMLGLGGLVAARRRR